MQSNKDGKMTDFIWWALLLKHMLWNGIVSIVILMQIQITNPAGIKNCPSRIQTQTNRHLFEEIHYSLAWEFFRPNHKMKTPNSTCLSQTQNYKQLELSSIKLSFLTNDRPFYIRPIFDVSSLRSSDDCLTFQLPLRVCTGAPSLFGTLFHLNK